MQQGIEYAQCLDVPFVYSSNGDGFLEHDMQRGTEREIKLDEFPSPEDLWMLLFSWLASRIPEKDTTIASDPVFSRLQSRQMKPPSAVSIRTR